MPLGAQSGFMYIGREVFDEIVATGCGYNPIGDRSWTFDLSVE